MKTNNQTHKFNNKYAPLQALFGLKREVIKDEDTGEVLDVLTEKATYTGIQKDIMIREGLHLPELKINRSEFIKNDIEILTLKTLKKANKQAVLKAGKNPKKVMNPDSSKTIYLKV